MHKTIQATLEKCGRIADVHNRKVDDPNVWGNPGYAGSPHATKNEPQTCGSSGVVKGSAGSGSVGGTKRSSAQAWTSSLAPRLERKAAAEAEQKHIYYEGEFCEAEDLPNGFTKIRNGNLVKLTKLSISDNHPCFSRSFI